VFAAAAAATWVAGMALSKTTDALDVRLGFGEALGGIILLAIAGSLPELAITVSAASAGHLDLAAGNLIGGIAVQTMVLVICDAVAGPRYALTFLAGALTPVLEALLVAPGSTASSSDSARSGHGPARDQLRHCCRSPGRQCACGSGTFSVATRSRSASSCSPT
jgi:hypothetical protein